jgi:hypothetical protein
MAEFGLEALAIANARNVLATGDAEAAWEWLVSVPAAKRPAEVVAGCLDRRSMAAGDNGDWTLAERLATEAAAAVPTPWRQERLGLLRRRRPTMGDHQWEVISAKVPPATKLPADALQPEVAEVAACGAYFSRGAGSGGPWARYLRLSKQPPMEGEERQVIFELAAGYFTRFVERHTPLLRWAEVVVPVPANPDRYVSRMASLPDELARGVEAMLGLPMLPNAVAWRSERTEVEMKQLHWSERRRRAREAFTVGDQASKARGHASRAQLAGLAQCHDPALDPSRGLVRTAAWAAGAVHEPLDRLVTESAPPLVGALARDVHGLRRSGDGPTIQDPPAQPQPAFGSERSVTVHDGLLGPCVASDSSTLAQGATHSADVNNVPGHNS